MPAKSNHLVQRSTTWHCRIDVPADLRAAFGNRRVLSKSLKTGDKLLAKALAAQVTGKWKDEFRAMRAIKLAKGDAWLDECHAYLAAASLQAQDSLTRNVMAAVTQQKPSPSPKALKAALDDDEVATLLGELIAGLIRDDVSADTITGVMNSFVGLYQGDQGERIAAATALNDFSKQADLQQATNKYGLTPVEQAEAASILANPASYKPKSPISRSAIEAFRKYQESQTDNPRTIGVMLSKLEAFSSYLTTEGKPLTFDTVADYLDTISDNRQSRQGHLWAMRKFHKWACRYNQPYRDQFAALPSPFAEHTHARVGKAGGESWTPYTPAEVVQLHKAALAKGGKDLADLIKFACYTGCRIEEIGRISSSTTIFENNQPVAFKVEVSKSEAGIRTIPIHPDLLPLYQHRLDTTQDGYLFAGKQDKAGKRLNAVQQRFTKLKREQGFTDLHVFHSFRGTVATQLEQAGANPLVITSIMGHRRGVITFDVYSAGASFEQKATAISLLSFAFD